MRILLIDATTERPIYQQIYAQIRDKIMAGEWEFSRKLPSSRQLAGNLQISRNTVEQAYQQLLAEGYLYSKPRSGYYVERLNTGFVGPGLSSSGQGHAIADRIEDQFKYDFRYGKLDYRYAPFKNWKKLMLECYGEEMDGLVSYGGHQGELGLREQVAKYVAEYRGVKCYPEQIVVGAGTLYCLGMLCNLIRLTTNAVGIEDPGYGKARAVFNNAGFKVCPISIERDGINIRELIDSGVKAVYVTPSHQFPTGTIMSISKRLQLLEWAVERQGIIIEDDYSCHFRYNVSPIPSLQGINDMANVAYVGNFSKPLLPSLRIAFIVLPPSLLDRYKNIYQNYNTSVPYLLQRTLEKFITMGYLNRHLRRVLQIYKRKHDCLIESLVREFGDRIEITGRNAGLFVTIRVNSELSETELIERAAELGVRVYSIAEHWERKQLYQGKSVLLGYSSLDLDEIKQGAFLLRQAWFR